MGRTSLIIDMKNHIVIVVCIVDKEIHSNGLPTILHIPETIMHNVLSLAFQLEFTYVNRIIVSSAYQAQDVLYYTTYSYIL